MATQEINGAQKCSLCLNAFKDPKVLPCCHTYCKDCLDRVLEKSKKKDRLSCPQCRAENKVPEGGPEGFLTDFTLIQDANDTQTEQVEEKAVVCGECDSTDPAVAYCCDCESYLCDFCSSAHKRMRHCRHHKVVAIETLLPEQSEREEADVSRKPLNCVIHPSEQLKLYCKTCESLACCNCIVAVHQGHTLGSVDKDARIGADSKLQSLTVSGQQKIATLRQELAHIRKVEQTAMGRPNELKSAINETFDLLAVTLENRRAQLLREAETKCNGDLLTVKTERESVERAVLGLEGVLKLTRRVFEIARATDLQFLSLSTQAIARLKELEKASWDSNAIEKVESTTQKFFGGDHKAYVQQVGKIEEQVRPLELAIQGLPASIELGRRREFKILSRAPKSRDFATLRPESMTVQICCGKSQKTVPILPAQKNPDNSWTVSFTPFCGGTHTIYVSLRGVRSPTSLFEYKTNVTGIPAVGARVRRGPDWNCNNEDGGEKKLGTVNSNDYSPDEPLYVVWDNGNGYSYSWGSSDKFQVEVMLNREKRSSEPIIRPRLQTK